jgi:hypothetical protein
MGRAPCDAASFFLDPIPSGKSRDHRKCLFCVRAKAYDQHDSSPAFISNRKATLENHLRACQHTPSHVKELFTAKRSASSLPDEVPALKRQCVVVGRSEEFRELVVEFHHDNLLADSFIDKGSTRRLFQFLCPGIILPSRRVLGGPWLRSYAKSVKSEIWQV